MKLFLSVLLLLVLSQYGTAQKISFKNIPIDTSLSFRGLSVVDDRVAWVSGKHGMVGITSDGGNHWHFIHVKDAENMDFRTLYAFNLENAIVVNAGPPAKIMRTTDGGANWTIVYTNKDPQAFIDGADFWNASEGIMYGDPINGHMLLLKTNDPGKTWETQNGPELQKGEASFAASGTGIRCYGKKKVMICTGGTASRLFASTDKGENWDMTTPPIIHGPASAGIFSVAFADDRNGIIVGGDYQNEAQKQDHVFYTSDGGDTWHAPTTTTGGYRECVEFINENTAIACGPGGADLTTNGGINWTSIANQKGLHVIRKARKGKLVIATGNGKICVVNAGE